jgi:hypothetical protein
VLSEDLAAQFVDRGVFHEAGRLSGWCERDGNEPEPAVHRARDMQAFPIASGAAVM